MQSTAGKRVLSTLAARIHPQLPLSPRESQQLLTLLTTSFRAHLDREHPLVLPESSQTQKPHAAGSHGRRGSSPARAASSYASATRHIDSILTNPLFAVKPRRRASEAAAVHVLRDPIAWFLNEIAAGTATLAKADTFVNVISNTVGEASPGRQSARTPSSVLAEWLRTSGIESSQQFLSFCVPKQKHQCSRFLDQLLRLFLAEGEIAAPWRWYIRSNQQRVKKTGLDSVTVMAFQQQLLSRMVSTQAAMNINGGLTTFLQAFRMAEMEGHNAAYSMLKPAGADLVNRIISAQNVSIDSELYQSFLLSSRRWLGPWGQAVESMLWLHHPTEPSALQGLDFIQNPTGAIIFARSSQSRRRFLVQLCLGVARQLIEQDKYGEANIAMEFCRENFADIVLPKVPVAHQQASEGEMLELLDRLIPT